jgi:hypothetical protein
VNVATELVFKLEKEPKGYKHSFAPNCKVNVPNTKGIVYLDYDRRHAVGTFENLRTDGEVVTADITIFEKMKVIEERFEYAIEGDIIKTNDDQMVEEVSIKGVAVTMPARD